MSIPVLTQVYDEVRRLSIAGSSVACGDFRLKKLVPPLQKAGEKAPVFAKVAEAVNNVVESNEKTAPEALLSLSTLINAILYTQGATGAEGKLAPIERVGEGITPKRSPASLLKSVATALTSTGSGRLEVIRESLERNPFPDPRLLGPAIAALDGSYHEVCDFVEANVLAQYGKSIVPMIVEKFDQKGGAGDARRLSLLYRVDPKGADKYVRNALKEGSKEVKVVAIAKLRDPSDVPFLIEQSSAKAADVREAAYLALAEINSKEAATALAEGIQKPRNLQALKAARQGKHPLVVAALHSETRTALAEYLATKPKDKNLAARSARLHELLQALRDRSDKDTEALLIELFEQRAAITKLEGTGSYDSIVLLILRAMATSTDKTRDLVIANHESLDEHGLDIAVEAAIRQEKPKRFYDLFHGYLIPPKDGKKGKAAAAANAKAEAVSSTLISHTRLPNLLYDYQPEIRNVVELDPRWLDLAIEVDDLPLAIQIARPKHPGVQKYLEENVQAFLKGKTESYEMLEALQAMIRINHPKAVDCLTQAMLKKVKYAVSYYSGIFSRLIGMLTPADVPKLEACIAKMDEADADRYIVAIADLKNRT
ncbi:HEAT repeat domain-containing protein [Blastopirellula sp. JC732]|uniref:HEAT repeat domain-containing protein n=1 Tax=Blastopirellula sediminis TaxID=2894196 RepID=A0A9X1SE07_9BACT|nr:HEAT repeat domain-containing protein [Blastopirellula sediminis]MCC9607957.1 HEAT repeat domain-containing protein [Blastopirellula sediminis]MCC9627250.1 HEAT repeat domain-containing protein [Blastopirellula sediminis]